MIGDRGKILAEILTKMTIVQIPEFINVYITTTFIYADIRGAETKDIKLKIIKKLLSNLVCATKLNSVNCIIKLIQCRNNSYLNFKM